MTKGEFEREVTRITRGHLETLVSPLDLMLDMLGDRGFQRPEVASIVHGVRQAVALALHQLDGVGRPAAVGSA